MHFTLMSDALISQVGNGQTHIYLEMRWTTCPYQKISSSPLPLTRQPPELTSFIPLLQNKVSCSIFYTLIIPHLKKGGNCYALVGRWLL